MELCSILSFFSSGSPLRCKAKLAASGVALSIPRKILLSVESAQKSSSFGAAVAKIDGVSEDTVLTLFLIHELFKPRKKSKWGPFLRCLPPLPPARKTVSPPRSDGAGSAAGAGAESKGETKGDGSNAVAYEHMHHTVFWR